METIMDTEMGDAVFLSSAPAFEPLKQANGIAHRNISTDMSREPSLLGQVAGQLNIRPSSPDDDDDDAAESVEKAAILRRPALPYSSLRTGLCYDARMRFHTELNPPVLRSDFHPEDPRRILAIYQTICQSGLFEDPIYRPKTAMVEKPLVRIKPRHAKREEVLMVHSPKHFGFLQSTATQSDDDLTETEKKYDSIYLNQSTYNAALLSAGSAIETTIAVARGVVKNAFAVIRPPGHHAESDRCMGFCHFDNVAIAAKVAQEQVPGIDKILIVDWDVHHGNGIQQAFYDDPNVLYISIHVHEDGRFYPSGPYGDHLHCGHGSGIGKNINIPWSNKGMGDADYLFAFQHVVMPIAYDFDPDLVLIASGFDAARGDQLGGCFVSPECYAHMTHMLMSVAGGKVVACLEGGYNLDSISLSALAVTKTLMGEAPPRIRQTAATKSGLENVRKVIMHQSQFWRCLIPKDISTEFDGFIEATKLHDIIRNYQSNMLFSEHQMISLNIFRSGISKSFENQVLATRNYRDSNPLLIIFHEPPEIAGSTNAITGKIELHGITVCDVISTYISWAIRRGFGVVDVNVPRFLTGVSDKDGLDEEEIARVNRSTKDLAMYLWENYIEYSETRKVVFLGTGDAYKGILEILNTRTWDNVGKFAGAAGCIDDKTILRPASEQFMTDFSRTYYRSTCIFVSHAHPAWDANRKKMSRKWGRLTRSPYHRLAQMLVEHRAEIQAFLLERAGLPADPDPPIQDLEVSKAVQAALGNAAKVKAEMNGNGDDMGDTIMVAGGVPADEL